MRLWMHADSFARDDDTLDITVDEIDQLTGIDGFANSLPADWLQVINEHTVKLPGFHDHNGTDAKRRALTAKRVAHHRDKVKRIAVTGDVVNGNAHALPDQTKTKTIEEGAVPALVLHESLPSEEWEQWLGHRRKRKWPCDSVTLAKQLRVLSPYDTPTQREMLNNSIQAGWQGIFPPKGNGAPKVETKRGMPVLNV